MKAAHSIVIIEDNAPDVFLIQESLKQAAVDYRLTTIGDGDEVLRFLDGLESDEAATLPDIILLDLNLPKRSGDEILSYLRKGRRCSRVPVIVMSSSDSADDRARSEVLGASAYFRKPVDLEQFMKIGELVQRLIRDPEAGRAGSTANTRE
jgi:CheY-like chemotaxis protein